MSIVDPDTISRPASATLDQQAVRSASSAVMAMTLFVASEAIFFAAFFGIYASAYTESKVWPPPEVPIPSLVLPTVGLGVLLVSAFTMGGALRTIRGSARPRGVVVWLTVTLACAVAFVAMVVAGYPELGFGIGQGIYESLFHLITALALAHVAGGIVLIGLVLARGRSGELQLVREPLRAAGIYWYFVVALGVVIYLLLYVVVAA